MKLFSLLNRVLRRRLPRRGDAHAVHETGLVRMNRGGTRTQRFPTARQGGRGKRKDAAQFFCGKPENSTPMVLAAAVVCGVFGRRDMVSANMAGSFFSPIA